MKLDILSTTGTVVKSTTLPKGIFEVNGSANLLNLAIRVYLSNQRQGTSKTKTRGEITATGAKIYRQKGTGRARHGDRKAPIFVGGGKSHGPKGEENYVLKLTKKMRRKALLTALSQKAHDKQIKLIDSFTKLPSKTAKIKESLKKIVDNPQNKILIILDTPQENIIKGTKNLSNVTITQAKRLNTYEILNHSQIIIEAAALETIKNTYTK